MGKFVYPALCLILAVASQGCVNNDNDKSAVTSDHDIWVIAHRGASAYAPENTIAAIEKALELKSDAIEIDFRQTKDCALVAFHDSSINRTTNGSGDVADYTLAELKQLDAGSWFSPAFKGESIPTVLQVAQAVNGRARLIFELKEAIDNCPSPVIQTIDAVKQTGIESTAIIKSFYYPLLLEAREMAPQIPQIYVYLLYMPTFNWLIDHWPKFSNPQLSGAQILQEHRFSLSEDDVKAIQRANKQIVVWDVQTEKAMLEAIEMGVDAIETDYPDVALRLIEQARLAK